MRAVVTSAGDPSVDIPFLCVEVDTGLADFDDKTACNGGVSSTEIRSEIKGDEQ